MEIQELLEEILVFRDERDWAQFHTPRNLVAALSVEVAELQELMLWTADEEVAELIEDKPGKFEEEIADVFMYSLLLAHEINIDIQGAIERKIVKNRERYPIDKAKGQATKYTDLEDS